MRRNQNPVQITINHNPTGNYAKPSEEQVRRAKQRAKIDLIRERKELEAELGDVWDDK